MYSLTPLKTKAVPIGGEEGPVSFMNTPPILSGQPQIHINEATQNGLSSLCYLYVWLICTYIHTCIYVNIDYQRRDHNFERNWGNMIGVKIGRGGVNDANAMTVYEILK